MTLLKWTTERLSEATTPTHEKVLVITNDVDIAATPPDLTGVDVVILDFPLFKDGRAFTQAQGLRKAGFQGDIRATGDLFHDQMGLAVRCGFTSFDLNAELDADAVTQSILRYGLFYQRAARGAPVWERRT